MAVDVVQTRRTATDREPEFERADAGGDVDVSDLTVAGATAFARTAVDGPVHVERRGGRTYLVRE